MKIIELALCCYSVTDMNRARGIHEGLLNVKAATITDSEHGHWTEYGFCPHALAIGSEPGFKPSPEGCMAGLEVDDFEAAIARTEITR